MRNILVDIKTNESKADFTSRRNLLKWGLVSLGTLALTTVPAIVTAQPGSKIKTLSFNANDIGILNFALLLEELEAAFYAGVVNSRKISNGKELEYMRALGAQEAAHVKFLREVLGRNALFKTSDLSFNSSGLAAVMTDRNTILNTAVALEAVSYTHLTLPTNREV